MSDHGGGLPSIRDEIHRDAVDTIALTGRRRAVVEDVAEMAPAIRAVNFGSHHAVASIGRGLSGAGDRRVEAWPAGSAFEFALGFEERLPASGAGKLSWPLFREQGAASRRFGPMGAHNVVLLVRQQPPPLGVAARDRIGPARHDRPLAQFDAPAVATSTGSAR